jgi:hypothetical protein
VLIRIGRNRISHAGLAAMQNVKCNTAAPEDSWEVSCKVKHVLVIWFPVSLLHIYLKEMNIYVDTKSAQCLRHQNVKKKV